MSSVIVPVSGFLSFAKASGTCFDSASGFIIVEIVTCKTLKSEIWPEHIRNTYMTVFERSTYIYSVQVLHLSRRACCH